MNNINSGHFQSRVDKWARHPRRIKFKSEIYRILHRLLKHVDKDLSKFYEVKHLRGKGKIKALKLRAVFGDIYHGCAFNYPQLSIAYSGEAFKTAEQWLKMIGSMESNETWIPKSVEKQHRFLTEGICAGFGIDIAHRYLHHESLTDIFSSAEKGGRLESFASHITYAILHETTPTPSSFQGFLLKLSQYKQFDQSNSLLDFSMEDLKNTMRGLQSLSLEERLTQIIERIATSKEQKDLPLLTFLKQITIIQIEMGKGKRITSSTSLSIDGKKLEGNPELNNLLLALLNRENKDFEKAIGIVARYRGMSLSHQIDQMGISELQKDDQSYLMHLDRLSDGCYMIHFDTGGGSHVITLIREGNTDTIIDPNLMILRSTNPNQTKRLISKLVKFYPAPSSAASGAINHRIEILKCEKL
jgi:hypothetical protein